MTKYSRSIPELRKLGLEVIKELISRGELFIVTRQLFNDMDDDELKQLNSLIKAAGKRFVIHSGRAITMEEVMASEPITTDNSIQEL